MTKHQGKNSAGGNEVEVEHAVLAYLHCHPQAADTLRGIVNWWLPQQRYESECQHIEHVLGRLVAEGLLHCDQLPDGEVLYALNKHTRSPQPH
ncbi:MAG TPA: hypothetical protein VIM06_08475 [Rhodanobacter sp.]|jgi:hypothetical protein